MIEGGSSINVIPERASMSVDMRSVASEEIDKLESYLRRVVEDRGPRREFATRYVWIKPHIRY